jgi:adenine/guanine phosphoribosyltransferase-like PRPP-binding protein
VTVVTEEEFRQRVDKDLRWMLTLEGGIWRPNFVTGPGRSGAIASVYVSHFLKVPFIPFGTKLPADKRGVLIVDTAMNTGRTIRAAVRRYMPYMPTMMWFYQEPPRVRFWYEEWP